MLDEKGNATTATTWQDAHSGRRRHKLMTKELGDTIPALYANENVEDYDAVVAKAKLFSPYTGWQLAARRFLLRGMVNVSAEWTLLATAFNLRTLWRVWRLCAFGDLLGGPKPQFAS